MKWGLATRNAAEAVDPPRIRQDEMRFMTPEGINTLLAKALQAQDRLAALWALAIYSGARQGELLALRWSDADFEAGTLTINRALERVQGSVGVYAEPKTSSSRRTITLDRDVLDMLREHRERQGEEKEAAGDLYADEDLIFCTRLGRPLNRFNVNRDFRIALARADLPRVRFHDLRHTSATLMFLAGIHPKLSGARLGHADIQTTMKYTHLVQGLDREAARRLGDAMRKATRKRSRPAGKQAPDGLEHPE